MSSIWSIPNPKRINARHQGEKLRHHLLGQGLITDTREITKSGIIRIVRLSEKGRIMLSEATQESEESPSGVNGNEAGQGE